MVRKVKHKTNTKVCSPTHRH